MVKQLKQVLRGLCLILWAGSAVAQAQVQGQGQGPMLSAAPSPVERLLSVGRPLEATIHQAACCRVCRKGKACGDSCISRDRTCRKGAGCACNG
ncbi:hypothetical protein NHU_01988 [Rhodovulum sulfidophilum]|uniref:Uncharacterized protein n=1 Tax=Rhodovulum sulfidophilum TaxID=35806 RepID=A0A0D6B1T8_RHOSU|nr:hypothetical protein NHU_01988 [Rhodovulum sulfidophilum]